MCLVGGIVDTINRKCPADNRVLPVSFKFRGVLGVYAKTVFRGTVVLVVAAENFELFGVICSAACVEEGDKVLATASSTGLTFCGGGGAGAGGGFFVAPTPS